jgi:hypothetical protein
MVPIVSRKRRGIFKDETMVPSTRFVTTHKALKMRGKVFEFISINTSKDIMIRYKNYNKL